MKRTHLLRFRFQCVGAELEHRPDYLQTNIGNNIEWRSFLYHENRMKSNLI